MMHGTSWLGRTVFACVMTPALAFCLHVELMTHHAPTLPLIPSLLGACVFGACVACVPPLGRRHYTG